MDNTKSVARDEIIKILQQVVSESDSSFEKISRFGPDKIPEAWIAADIVKAIGRNETFLIVPEWPHKEIGFPSGDGKIDIAIFNGDVKYPRFLIEIKGPQNRWNSVKADCKRIFDILNEKADVESGLFVCMFTNVKRSDAEKEAKKLCDISGITPDALIRVGDCQEINGNADDRCWFAGIACIERSNNL